MNKDLFLCVEQLEMKTNPPLSGIKSSEPCLTQRSVYILSEGVARRYRATLFLALKKKTTQK